MPSPGPTSASQTEPKLATLDVSLISSVPPEGSRLNQRVKERLQLLTSPQNLTPVPVLMMASQTTQARNSSSFLEAWTALPVPLGFL